MYLGPVEVKTAVSQCQHIRFVVIPPVNVTRWGGGGGILESLCPPCLFGTHRSKDSCFTMPAHQVHCYTPCKCNKVGGGRGYTSLTLHSFLAAPLFYRHPSVQNTILPNKVLWSALFLLPGSSYLEPTPCFCPPFCLCQLI